VSIYSLSKITKCFGEKTILNINYLDIKKGKIYALFGANGAGKTTLLNILAFLDNPSSGEIFFDFKKVKFLESYLYLLRKKVVMIAQNPIMFSTTVYKNIEFGLKIRKFSKKERQQIIYESLELVDMQHMAQAYAKNLSGGETQRIAFARALALSPEVILCDEPTSSVDLENQAKIINILSKINKQKNISLIFTSHDKLQTSNLAHYQIFLEHGKIAVASYENLFTGVVSEQDRFFSKCIIQKSLNIIIPPTKLGKTRILINPEKIKIVKNLSNDEVCNIFRGKIIQIAEEKEKIRIIINFGINMTLLITRQKYLKQQKLFIIGNKINVHTPQASIQIL
jgi:tungstate transport system ATP-binding protein